MKFKPNRPVRVGTKMMRTDDKGEVKTPTIDAYAKELEALTENARKVAAGAQAPAEVDQSAATEAPAPTAKSATKKS